MEIGCHPSDLSENRMSQKLDDEPPCFPDERQTYHIKLVCCYCNIL